MVPEEEAASDATVLAEYRKELERSRQPGYIAPNLDGEADDDSVLEPMRRPAGSANGRAAGGVDAALHRLQDGPSVAYRRSPELRPAFPGGTNVP